MSDNKININSSIGKTLDYLRDLLGGKERNALERNLERDSFEKDAMEGFQSLGADDLEADLKELNKKLSRRLTKSNRVLIYRVAAGIAVILTLSISYLMVFDKQIDEFPENLQVSERVENEDTAGDKSIELSDELIKQMEADYIENDVSVTEISPNIPDAKPEEAEGFLSKKEAEDQAIVNNGKAASTKDEELAEITLVIADESEVAMTMENTDVLAFQTTVEEVADEKAVAAPEAVAEIFESELAVQKSASRAKKTAAPPSVSSEESVAPIDAVGSPVLSHSIPYIAIKEVVIFSPGEEKETTDYIPAQPETGIRKFRKYIEDNFSVQGAIPENNALVVIAFVVNEKGKPERLRVVESPDTTFSKEAIRLVEEGPLWIPAKQSGNFSAEETRLKIVFKN